MSKKTIEIEKEQQNSALLNVITPLGMEFKKNSISIGENTCKVYGVIKYPPTAEMGWLSKITNIQSTISTIVFNPVDNGELISAISRNIKTQRGLADSTKDPLSKQRAEKAAEDGEKIIMQIDREGEVVGLMSVQVMAVSKNEVQFNKICRRAESVLSTLKCKMRVVPNLQKESFMHMSPSFPTNSKIEQILERIVPLSTMIGGFPFASTGFNDGSGYYFAKDAVGGLVTIDTWKRGNDRTNSNFVIMGNSGTGKSTAIKSILLSEYMKGTKIFIIDPESEYKSLCKKLNGDFINAAGGSNGMINPLQIRPQIKDEEDENEYENEYEKGLNDLAIHMKNLEIFFQLYIPSIKDMQKAVLKKCLIELYQNFGITWETDISSFKNDEFPIFMDLYNLIKEKVIEDSETYGDLLALLADIAVGADSFLWNGHSTMSSTSNFVCLDTNALQQTSDEIKRTQYFNLLTYCWEQMSKDRTEKVMLVCDEAYLMVDNKVPQSLVYLRNVMKRARKYEASLALVTQSLDDFLNDNIRQYGQALLDVPCYKLLFGTDGPNLKQTSNLYDLTEAEEELLMARKRGHALFMVGAKRLHIYFDIPDYKMDYIGRAGGR